MKITFKTVEKKDHESFAADVQSALSEAVVREFGYASKEEIVPTEDVYGSLNAPNSDVLYIFADYRKAGGAVISIDKEKKRNELALFYLYPEFRDKGIGSIYF